MWSRTVAEIRTHLFLVGRQTTAALAILASALNAATDCMGKQAVDDQTRIQPTEFDYTIGQTNGRAQVRPNTSTAGGTAMSWSGRWRRPEELEPIVTKLAENAVLVERFRSVTGSERRDLVEEVLRQIIEFAKTIDPSIGVIEGSELMVLLGAKLRHSGDAKEAPEPSE